MTTISFMRARAHTHMDIILLVISTYHFWFAISFSLMSAGVWLASKNEVLRCIDEAETPTMC